MSNIIQGTKMVSTVEASAQYIGAGAIWMEEYEPEIHDWNRRTTLLWQRLRPTKAVGQPFKYHEQRSLPGAPKMTNPRVLSYNAQVAPGRQEKLGYVKACVDSLDFGMFEVELAAQQGKFPQLEGKDLEDMVVNMLVYLDEQVLIGDAPSVITDPTTNENFCGFTNQLAGVVGIGAGSNISDGIKTACINWLVANKKFLQMPNEIHMHPVTIGQINEQEKGLERHVDKLEIVPGVVVTAIVTVFGLLPLIPNFNCPEVDLAGTLDAYEAYIVSSGMLELRYVTSAIPRVFQLGLLNDMATKHTVVLFAAPVAVDARRPDNIALPLQHAKIAISKTA